MARILFAEDDDQMRAFLSRGLRRAGHAVEAVPDGEAALVQSQAAEYDRLLADVVMPGVDGIELARRGGAPPPRNFGLVLHRVFPGGVAGGRVGAGPAPGAGGTGFPPPSF